MNEDERFMARALELAAEAPFTAPNPKVGAVIVHDGAIISEGYHRGSGTPHAEAVALEGLDARGATLYVNLEPCTHHGKMPPCAPLVISSGITRCVIGTEDPDERVAGRGIAALRAAGMDVTVGVSEGAARALNLPYFHQRATKRPLVTLKLALSLDGKMAAPDGSSRWITGEMTRRRVHARRLETDGILIGAGTVLADDPLLTVRDVAAPRQPTRVLVDASGRVPVTSQIFGRGDAIVMTTIASPHTTKTRWKEAGAEVVVVDQDPSGRVNLADVLANLGGRGWLEIYCEGGAELATSLLRDDLVDRLDLNYGPVLVGGNGVGLGDLGVATMGEASRWRTVDVSGMGQDAVVTLERDR
ncbi:MAG: diaminohydroxyphosphoribosylaminopyrimidine deaminase [Actinomycetota bacterium]|jgi:diaminohydroxyphosphoribosylaminopyrimidine deaminase/5-amino-6-(5-phosphoribosylamino)uracil reductase|nr:diaminohydroxyphosphoribosylaminopyrimidine deaminase [Actinomycetota bacterium]